MPTPSESAAGLGPGALPRTRDRALASLLRGRELRERLCGDYDALLAALPVPDGAALVAVGGLGRREVAPYSDLDLVLLTQGSVVPAQAAGEIWYPLWDSGIPVDHAVRTLDECVAVAAGDLHALLGLLWARPVAGDAEIAMAVRDRIRRLWRTTARRRLGELGESCRARWRRSGEGAYALEPDLKQARGGLRDSQILAALAVAQLADFRAETRRDAMLLLDVRGELHREAGRHGDILRRQYQQPVAAALDVGDADDLLRAVNLACRAIAHELSATLRRVGPTGGVPPRRPSASRFAVRRPLAQDLVADDGQVAPARSARIGGDPLLLLRAARVASETSLPLAPYLLRRLAERTDPLSAPWSAAARGEFVRLLAGSAVVDTVEALDVAGLMPRILPAWTEVRGRAQHNPVHRHTVDRHLVDTVAAAAAHRREVARPDLLLVAALLHDIGKIGRGDHAEVGAPIARSAAAAMCFTADDVSVVELLVRRHLLLVDTATGRDLDDPRTLADVQDAIGGRSDVLDLLYALTRADAEATGPAAWTPWRASLVADLVRRVQGVPPEPPPKLPERWRRLAESPDAAVLVDEDDAAGEITVVAPDGPGVLARTAGVLALHGLEVRAADVRTHRGRAVNTFHAEPLFGNLPDAAVLRGDLARTLAGPGDLAARLQRKERAYRRGDTVLTPPTTTWLDEAATGATVLEVRADWSIGALYRITAALERCGLDIRSARIRSWGGAVIASFYVRTSAGAAVPPDLRAVVDADLVTLR